MTKQEKDTILEVANKAHSSTPWRAMYGGVYMANREERIATCVRDSLRGYPDDDIAISDASHIVEAVNSHERLVEENARLRELVRRMIHPVETTLADAIKDGEVVKVICGTDEATKTVDKCVGALRDLLAEARAALGEESAND